MPPSNVLSPVKWGEEETVHQHLGDHANIRFTTRLISFTYPFSPEEVVDHFRLYFGPIHKAFQALEVEPDKQTALRNDLARLWTNHNQRSDGTTFVESEYLDVHATKL